jgi:hypothetical protein
MDTPILKGTTSRSKSRSKSKTETRSPKSETRSHKSGSKSETRSHKSETRSKSKSPKDEASFKLKSSSSPKSKSKSASIQDIDLKMPDVLPGKLNYSERIAKKMEKTFQMHKDVQPFTGTFYFTNLFYLYLFKKYKMRCVITNSSAAIALTFNFKNKERMSVHRENIEECSQQIFECVIRGQNIIIIPLMFQVIVDQRHVGGHANLLIYRVNTGELEHFEPHGAKYGGTQQIMVNKKINAVLSYLVETINDKIRDFNEAYDEKSDSSDSSENGKIEIVTLITAQDVCPLDTSGLQALEQTSVIPKNALIEPGGYCTAWSMFFAELCLKNPEYSSRQIHDAIIEKTELYDNKNDYLRNVIRGYTCFINNKIAKHFSHVFDEPVSSVKIHSMLSEFSQNGQKNVDFTNYIDKIFEIMDVEMDIDIIKTNSFPDVKVRYNEFTEGIRTETSSSSIKSEDRVSSPKRASIKMSDSGVAKGKTMRKSTRRKSTRRKSTRLN